MTMKLEDALQYIPESGSLIWKISPSTHIPSGSIAGSLDGRGYRQVRFRGRNYLAHRVAWFLMTRSWPTKPIVHRNCNKSDNRWENLREATPTQNNANRFGQGNLPKGVTLHRSSGKYQAQIKKCGKNYYLGLFDSVDDAADAYSEAAGRLFGEFARVA